MGSGKPFSVLIADDNKDAADALGTLLELHGYAVRVVYSGPAAVLAAASDPPDCAILDIGMPGMNGYAVARTLRADPATAAVKLVAFSAYDKDQFGPDGEAFDLHLVKGRVEPADLARVLAMMRDAGRLAGDIGSVLDGARARPE